MKKILNIVIATICAAGLFTACETERDNPVLNSSVAKPVITSDVPQSVTIVLDNLEEIFTTLTFTPSVYSTDVPVMNQLQMSLSEDFPADATVAVGAAVSESSIVLQNKTINSAVTLLGASALTPVKAYLRIKSWVTATTGSPVTEMLAAYSDVKQVIITPYEAQPAYIYAIGQFQGWNTSTPATLTSLTDNGVYIGYIDFPAGNDQGWLISGDKPVSWSLKYGGTTDKNNIVGGGTATLVFSGSSDNLPEPGVGVGYWKITADLNAMTVTTALFGKLGVVGTINGWGGSPDVPMTYNSEQHRFEATITCAGNDEIKFRLNSDWGSNWGGTDGVASAGGANIVVANAGSYLVTLDMLTMKYTVQ
ncbi:MAG: SusE domain-containing protein [Paludibacter sp.]|nr:SusE domain-containing protein [Paludibacter sp.]